MEMGEKMGNARSTHNIVKPWIKINKTNKSQKNGGYFWWGFSKLGKNTRKLGSKMKRGGSEIVINVPHGTKMM